MRKRDGHFVNFCTLTPFSPDPIFPVAEKVPADGITRRIPVTPSTFAGEDVAPSGLVVTDFAHGKKIVAPAAAQVPLIWI